MHWTGCTHVIEILHTTTQKVNGISHKKVVLFYKWGILKNIFFLLFGFFGNPAWMWLLLFLPGKGERGREAAAGIFSSASAAVGCYFFPLRSHLNFLFFAGFALLSDFRLFFSVGTARRTTGLFPSQHKWVCRIGRKKTFPRTVHFPCSLKSKDNLKTCSPPFKVFLRGHCACALSSHAPICS